MSGIPLADSEWLLMQAIWKLETPTLRDILNEVEADTGWTRHTVISYLNRMEAKGAISQEGSRPKIYRPLWRREDVLRQETGDLLTRVYGGNPFLMAVSAVKSGPMTLEEKQQLLDLIEGI